MTSKRTHRAAAGLLALAMPLAHGAGAAAAELDTRPAGAGTTVSDPATGSAAMSRDLSVAAAHVLVLPPPLRTEVRSAIGSARAAATNATDAIRTAASAEDEDLRWRAGLALEDAQTALSAAGAELRFVLERVEGIDAGVTLALRALEHDVAVLAEHAAGATGA